MRSRARPTGSSGGDRVFLAALVAAGIALRLLWLARTDGGLTGFVGGGEAARTALSLARSGTFGDAFWDGSGPTAHLMPASPALASLAFRLFAPAGAAASVTLLAWSLAQSVAAILLLHRLFARLGADPRALRWAAATLLLAIVYAPEETIAYRYWDNALAVCLSVPNLLAAVRVERSGQMSGRAALGWALLWAATSFVSPVAGLALALVWAWVALRRLPFASAARFALLSAVAIMAVLAPWTIRNAHELGAPVVLRSNFGLEFATGNHADALSDRPPAQVFLDRVTAIHPLFGRPGREALLRAGGEVAYSRALGAETWRWVAAHPLGFLRLSLRHLLQFFFPPAWLLIQSNWEELMPLRAGLIAVVDLAGIVALAAGIRQRRAGFVLLAIFVGAVAAPYALVQPNPRYTYLVYGLLAFAAWDGAVRLAGSRPGAAKAR